METCPLRIETHHADAHNFMIHLKHEPDGPSIDREPVLASDVVPLFSEAWLAGYLRKGMPDIGYTDIEARLVPEYDAEISERCSGLYVESRGPDGNWQSQRFGIRTLVSVADRCAKRLRDTGVLTPGMAYYWHVTAECPHLTDPLPAPRTPEPDRSVGAGVTHRPLPYLLLPLDPLIERATAVGPVDRWFPVVYFREAHIMAERFARQGGAHRPPTESGSVMFGILCSCPRSGEFYMVVTEAVELVGTLETTLSLTYSDRTWHHIQNALDERHYRSSGHLLQMVGQSHGHNFIPQYTGEKDRETGRPAENFSTSVFVSPEDVIWSRAVFSYQPWSICHIFGYTDRAEPDQGLFGFRGGRLARRGFYVVDSIPEIFESTRSDDVDSFIY